MKSKNEMLDRGLASIDPGRAEDWQSEASNADALLAEILASDPNEGASPGRPHLRSSRKRAFAVVAVGAVALIAAIVDLPNGGGGERGTLPVLARVAEAAAKQPAQDTSLPYFYTKTRGTYVDTSVYDREHQWSTYDTVVVGLDPPASARSAAAACGIVAAGISEAGSVYVLEDASVEGLSPERWAARAIALYRRHQADCLVAEVNMGGDMVRAVIREADANVPVITVRATRGKYLRAEPVAQLYEQGRVKHVGGYPALEDEMCDFGLDGLTSGRSPDRLDALVWAVTALSFGARAGPRVRGL